jgi:outer membrane immunogenic protein
LRWQPRVRAGGCPFETFKGPRVGVTLGYDKSRSGSSVDIDNTRNFKQSIDGLLYGGEIGYDVPLGSNLVVGADAELTDSTAKWTAQGAPNTFNLGRVSAGRDVYVARGSVMRCRPRRCST